MTKIRWPLGCACKAVFRASVLALGLLPSAVSAQPAASRQALALGLDVSGSVDALEYQLQLEGLAQALTDPDVRDALIAQGAAPVALYVFEWSGPAFQNVLQDWVFLDSAQTLFAVADGLRRHPRSPAPPSTALGTAIATGARAIAQGPACWSRTLDISGDGKSNTGPRPQDIKDLPALSDLTVNALVILTEDRFGSTGDDGDLLSYFETLVIRGPDAFALPADGFEDYARAMKEKLLREIKALAVGAVVPATRAQSVQ